MVDNMTEKKLNGENDTEEAHAYTPGLKVKRATMVDKMRRLPLLGDVYPKVGDVVNYDDIIAKTEISGDPEILKLAMQLGFEPEDCQKFMTKQIGDLVEKASKLRITARSGG